MGLPKLDSIKYNIYDNSIDSLADMVKNYDFANDSLFRPIIYEDPNSLIARMPSMNFTKRQKNILRTTVIYNKVKWIKSERMK